MRIAWTTPAIALVCAIVATAGCGQPQPVGTISVEPASFRLGYPESVGLRLTWEPTRPLEESFQGSPGHPTVFVHLLDDSNKVVRTFDHPLPEAWAPGVTQSYVIDVSQSALAAPLPPGRYGLSLGLYHVDWGFRWPIETGGAELAKREYRVATVEVPDGGGGPRFEFTSGWLPSESRDQQVPMRRRLAAEASVRVSDIGTPGTLLFALAIGAPDGKVVVRSDCDDGTQRHLTGTGSHTVEVEVGAAAAPTACAVEFEPRGSLSGCGTDCPAFLEQATFRTDSDQPIAIRRPPDG